MGVGTTMPEPGLPEPAETIVACVPLADRRTKDGPFLNSVLDMVPEGGRAVVLRSLSVMFGIRTGAFRSRVTSEYRLTHAFRIEHGFGNAVPLPAIVMVIDRKPGTEPTEFVSVPCETVPDRDWTTWPGLEYNKTFVEDDSWMDGFEIDCCISMREGVKLGTIESVRKGTMIRSDRLSPPPKRHPGSRS